MQVLKSGLITIGLFIAAVLILVLITSVPGILKHARAEPTLKNATEEIVLPAQYRLSNSNYDSGGTDVHPNAKLTYVLNPPSTADSIKTDVDHTLTNAGYKLSESYKNSNYVDNKEGYTLDSIYKKKTKGTDYLAIVKIQPSGGSYFTIEIELPYSY